MTFFSFVTSIAGLLSAVVIFVVGQIILKAFIEPIQEQRKLIGKVAFVLAYERAIQGSDVMGLEDRKKAVQMMIDLAGDLRSSLTLIPCYDALEEMGAVRKAQVIHDVAYWLLQIVVDQDMLNGLKYTSEIRTLLNLKERNPDISIKMVNEKGQETGIQFPGDNPDMMYIDAPDTPWIPATDEEITAIPKPTPPA